MTSILTTQFDFEIVNLHHQKLLIDNISYIHYAISLLGSSFFLVISNHIAFIENMNLIKNLLKPKLPYCNIFFSHSREHSTPYYIHLFWERLPEKVLATIPKGIMGGFECTVLQRNLEEWHGMFAMLCLRLLKESNKSRFDSYSR